MAMGQQNDRQKKAALCLLCTLVVWCFIVYPSRVFSAEETGAVSNEYLLKAVCMYNFSQFTRWPDPLKRESFDAIVLGIVGDSPFGNALQELQTSLIKQNKKIKVTYYGTYAEGMDLRGSHILFVSSSEQGRMGKIINSLENGPVMTISDAPGFLEAGGMISLVLMGKKVRWRINRSALDSAGIQVSAKLLQLAIHIEDNPDHSGLKPDESNEHNPWTAWPGAIARSHLLLQKDV